MRKHILTVVASVVALGMVSSVPVLALERVSNVAPVGGALLDKAPIKVDARKIIEGAREYSRKKNFNELSYQSKKAFTISKEKVKDMIGANETPSQMIKSVPVVDKKTGRFVGIIVMERAQHKDNPYIIIPASEVDLVGGDMKFDQLSPEDKAAMEKKFVTETKLEMGQRKYKQWAAEQVLLSPTKKILLNVYKMKIK